MQKKTEDRQTQDKVAGTVFAQKQGVKNSIYDIT